MKIDLQKLFNSRLFTMAISLLIAIVAWVVVVTTISTEGESVIKGVPVNFSYDSASYTVNGLDIVSSPSATVDLRIQGPRSYVNNLSRDDFLVYPNYSSVRGAGEYELSLVVKVQDNNWESNQASILNDKNLPTVSVVFDTVITKTFAITTDTSNVQIADGYIFAAIAGIAGEEKFLDALGYEDGIWEDNDVKAALKTVVQLRNYLEPTTVAQANGENFQNNQQAVIGEADGSAKGTALFIPNGDWLPSEMAESTPEGFEWGFMPLPKTDEGNGAVATNLELVYLHEDGKNLDLAKQFLLFYFSDEGAKIVAEEANAIIPTKDALTDAAENGIAQSTIDLYDVYNWEGYSAAVGSFVATGTVTGVNWNDVLFNDLNDDVFNSAHASTSIENLLNTWANKLETASDQFRAVII